MCKSGVSRQGLFIVFTIFRVVLEMEACWRGWRLGCHLSFDRFCNFLIACRGYVADRRLYNRYHRSGLMKVLDNRNQSTRKDSFACAPTLSILSRMVPA